jgi:prefoldin subunit 5
MLMDEDIRKDINMIGRQVSALGRQMSSVNCNILGLKAISKSLRKVAKAIDIYVSVQEERDKETIAKIT